MRYLMLLLFVLATVSCAATSDVMRLDNTVRVPTQLSEVVVLVENPSRPYSVIAMVEISDQGWGLSLEELKQSMLKQAAALGGDAVIVGMGTSQSSGSVIVPAGNSYVAVDDVVKKLTGKVVVYTGDQ